MVAYAKEIKDDRRTSTKLGKSEEMKFALVINAMGL